jgi:hypothetical protein
MYVYIKSQSDFFSFFLPPRQQQLFSDHSMVDIARVFSPVVVFASSEARPQSSDRIRSTSAKRISSAGTRHTSRVSSAVSTVESIDSGGHNRYGTNEINDEKDLEAALREELTTRK